MHLFARIHESLIICSVVLLQLHVGAQISSGSKGTDGAFNPTASTVINMADHPDGVYHYTSVRIPGNVTVSFLPNANNTPVVWLVQGNVTIDGTIDIPGKQSFGPEGAPGGPGGFRGGNGGTIATPGQGPGGGLPNRAEPHAAHGTLGGTGSKIYGNSFLLPLIGGSGGGSNSQGGGGGGGGGAILIASSGQIQLNGSIQASGGVGHARLGGGAGSGGAVRLVAKTILGRGIITTFGGVGNNNLGLGRIRLDALENNFAGRLFGVSSQGFQPIIIPTTGEGSQLKILSVGGIGIKANPTGVLVNPDAIISGEQANPIPIVVQCSNIPLNTAIKVTIRPAVEAEVSVTGLNTLGDALSSTATVFVQMPRGGGIIYATATTGN